MKTFYFNTGVKPHNSNGLREGESWIRGEKHIAFDCEDVPEGATLKFLCDNPNLPGYEKTIVREVFNSHMASKYAYFTNPQ